MKSTPSAPPNSVATNVSLSPEDLALATHGRWEVAPGADWRPTGLCFESKFFEPGQILLASHEPPGLRKSAMSIQAAKQLALNGASAVILPRAAPWTGTLPVLRVDDPFAALLDLSRFRRDRFGGKIIAVTGSVGKTTTRTMLHEVLATDGPVSSTPHNYNLVSGVALTLASMNPTTRYGVLEVAIGAPGSLSTSAGLCRPDVAILTGVAPVHLANRGTTEKIAAEKSLLFTGLSSSGVAIINRDTLHFEQIAALAAAKAQQVVTYGSAPNNDSHVIDIVADGTGSNVKASILGQVITYRVGAPGRHLVMNSLAALAAAAVLDIDLDKAAAALTSFRPPLGRGQKSDILVGATAVSVIDDAFNANPASMRACLDILSLSQPGPGGRRMAVLGDMLELGPDERRFHRDLLTPILNAKLDRVHVFGPLMSDLWDALPPETRGIRTIEFDHLVEAVRSDIRNGDLIAVKGSHGTGLHAFVAALAASARPEVPSPGKAMPPSVISATVAKSDAPPAPAAPVAPNGTRQHSMIIQRFDDSSILHDVGSHLAHQPASLNKLMTLFLTFQAIETGALALGEWLHVSDRAAATPGSRLGLDAKTSLLVHDAINGLVICSANDAANVLAERLGGTVQGFVKMMNAQAADLGLSATRFRNAHGMNYEGQLTSARDMLTLARAVKDRFPQQWHWFGHRSFVFKGQIRWATNTLLNDYAGLDGMVTGHTPSSGYHLAFSAERAGLRLIGVAMGYPDATVRNEAVARALDDAFATASKHERPRTGTQPNGRPPATLDRTATNTHLLHKPSGDASISLLGDFYLGDYYMRWRDSRGKSNILAEKGVGHCFAHFSQFLAANDLNVVNLEAALTRLATSPLAGKKDWVLDADPDRTLACLRDYNVQAVTLGNNHAVDFGTQALSTSFGDLARHGLLWSGAGQNDEDAALPLTISVRIGSQARTVLIFSAYAYNEKYDKTFGFFAGPDRAGVAALSNRLQSRIATARRDDPTALIILVPHWGANYEWRSTRQAKLATQFLEAGVDIIVGHGAHMMQEIERRSHRWVVYSIGNFVFNNHGEYAKRGVPAYSLATRLVFTPSDAGLQASLRLYPFYCDNLVTDWQPRWVDEEEFAVVLSRLTAHLATSGEDTAPPSTGKDAFGHFLELNLDP